MIDWTWTQKFEDGKFRVLSAMNISVLYNGSSSDPNVNPESETSSRFFALRDIKEGDGELVHYLVCIFMSVNPSF